MKKLGLIITLGLILGSAPAFAQANRQDSRVAVSVSHNSRIDWQINRLNRMLAHVRSELSRYRGNWRLRREVVRISHEVNRVNWRHRHGHDSLRLRREVDRLRAQLRSIEVQLHVRRGEWYRWD